MKSGRTVMIPLSACCCYHSMPACEPNATNDVCHLIWLVLELDDEKRIGNTTTDTEVGTMDQFMQQLGGGMGGRGGGMAIDDRLVRVTGAAIIGEYQTTNG